MQQAGRTLMLSDLAREFQWVQMLGWSEDELESVPVHEEATAGDEMLNLSNFGGTALGVSANAGGGTSANTRSIQNLWVYRRETPPPLWDRLRELMNRGGPSGYNASGQFGETSTETFPPSQPGR
ncbi:MAG TPA: hypothetical protein VK066_30245 [Chloroflexota bacterium]|nr:hypothetical protein [Chloroflexota bacterium]